MDPRTATGLEPQISEVYLLAIRVPGITRARLIAERVDPALIDIVIRELLARGMLRPGPEEDSWEAMPPDVALPAVATMWEGRAAEARILGQDLGRLYHQVRATPTIPHNGVRTLTGLQDLHDTTAEVLAAATEEVRCLYTATPRTAFVFASGQGWPGALASTREGQALRRRTIYDASVTGLPQASGLLSRRAATGEEFRFVTDLTTSFVIADDTQAVIDLTAFDSSGAGSLHLTDRRVILALTAEWESWWRRGTPGTNSSAVVTDELDPRSQDILRLLAAGATDSAIALQMGLAQRTVERGVKALLDRLGATTRFQAGVQAALRGWL